MKYFKIKKEYVNILNNLLKNKIKIKEVDCLDHYENGIYHYFNGYDKYGEALIGKRANGLCISESGLFVYLKNGKLHREDGPAAISVRGHSWYVNGIHIEELDNKCKVSKEKLNLLLLKYSYE